MDNAPNSRFIVLLDQDRSECKEVKRRIVDICRRAGKSETIVRIACRELESWYFGDIKAVEEALDDCPKLASHTNKSKYRIPDDIDKPSLELERITKGKYQKISGSRAIGTHLSSQNRSKSYNVFLKSLKNLIEDSSGAITESS